MIKKILTVSLLGLLTVSCSADRESLMEEPASQPQPVTNDANIAEIGLRLSVDKSQGNIFESFIFKLEQNNQSVYFGNLTQYLDLLVFRISDTEGQKIIFEKHENGNQGTIQFNHHFYYPGHYTASIEGYKNGKIVFTDKKDVTVSDTRDFLAVNWDNFTATENSIGYFNAVSDNRIAFFNGFDQMNPYVVMSNSWNSLNPNSTVEIAQKDKEFFYNYLVKYYSAPTYSENGSVDLKNVYLQHFKKAIKNNVPVQIWLTSKNNIALIKSFSETDASVFYGYRVIAEPK